MSEPTFPIPEELRPIAEPIARAVTLRRELPVLQAVARNTGEKLSKYVDAVWEREGAPACRKGCSFCCHIKVTVTAPEVFDAIDYARATMSAERFAAVVERARQNAATVHGVSSLDYPTSVACAFLEADGSCGVYEARPLACRPHHSFRVELCKQVYETGEDVTPADGDVHQGVKAVGDNMGVALVVGLHAGRVNASQYELQEAVAIAGADPGAGARWLAGQPVLGPAVAEQAPPL